MGVGDLAEIVEGAQVVLRHAVAVRIHAADLPLRREMTLIGRVLRARSSVLAFVRAFGHVARRLRRPSPGASDAVLGLLVPSKAKAGSADARRAPSTLATADQHAAA